MNWNAFQHSEEQRPVGQKPWKNVGLKCKPVTHRVPIDDGLTHVLTMDCACSPWTEDLIVDESTVVSTMVYHNPQDGRSNIA
jgi:hypothetical protein